VDSITHIVVGAVAGELILGRKLGRWAMLWGALAQSAPDVDGIAHLWTGPAEGLLVHRGFTHSLLFCALITPVFALAAARWHRPRNIRFPLYLWFFGVEVLGHILLDGLNSYGTGWFEPFYHARVSLNLIFVADPFFSIGPGIAALVLLLLKRKRARLHWAIGGVAWCGLYLLYCGANKMTVEREVHAMLRQQEVRYTRTFITPTALNNWLWYVVAEDDTGYHIGYRSVFDTSRTMDLRYVPRNRELLHPLTDHPELHVLLRFSQGYYTVERGNGRLVFNDLRFGQVLGWRDPDADFVFHWSLDHPEENELVIQRGRFQGWDRDALGSLVRRIGGDQRSRR
jgi:inner membrane protein